MDPRGDTETLIDFVIEKPVKSILELGTGSGAIAITLACEWKEVHVTAIDISEDALSLAKINAEKFNVQNKIHFLSGGGKWNPHGPPIGRAVVAGEDPGCFFFSILF